VGGRRRDSRCIVRLVELSLPRVSWRRVGAVTGCWLTRQPRSCAEGAASAAMASRASGPGAPDPLARSATGRKPRRGMITRAWTDGGGPD